MTRRPVPWPLPQSPQPGRRPRSSRCSFAGRPARAGPSSADLRRSRRSGEIRRHAVTERPGAACRARTPERRDARTDLRLAGPSRAGMSVAPPTVDAVIASLRGTVLEAAGALLVVEVGGVGYAVTVAPDHALAVRHGEEVLLHTAMVVREDDISLFGFQTREQLAVFDLLRGVTGVGPKSAMGVLAALSPAEIAAAVSADDDAVFRRVSGIGPKTAKLIVVSLAGKLID